MTFLASPLLLVQVLECLGCILTVSVFFCFLASDVPHSDGECTRRG